MRADERQLILEHLAASESCLLTLVAPLTPTQWAFRESPDRWSIAENIEHLIHFESFITQAIQNALERPAEPEKQAEAARKQSQVLSLGTNESRQLHFTAREVVLPTGQWPTSVLTSEFRQARASTLAFASVIEADLHSHFFRHIAFGDLDCHQWLLVLALHTERHALQIVQVQAHPAYPAGDSTPRTTAPTKLAPYRPSSTAARYSGCMSPNTPPTLLVLAAGMGSRYGGLKQIDSVGPSGETIMDYSIYDALRAGFGKVVFIIRKDIEEAFRQTIGARFEKHVAVDYVFQELDKLPTGFTPPAGRTKPWGTTQAVMMAADAIQEPFAVINADDFYGAASYRELARHLQSGTPDYAMVGFILSKTLSDFGSVARGVCQVGAEGELTSIVELTSIERDGPGAKNTDPAGIITPLTGNELVSMNMWGFTPQVFPQLASQFQSFLEKSGAELKSECYLPSTVNALVAAGQAQVKVLSSPDAWFGVTYREDRPSVVASIGKLIEQGLYPESLWA